MCRWLVVGLLTASFAAGCGGDDDGDGSSATAWADDVCSAIATWTSSVSSATDSVQRGGVTADELRNAFEDVDAATSEFVDEMRGLGAPDTDSGQQAKELFDELTDDIEENVSTIEEAVGDASGASGVLEALTTVSGTVSTMGEQLTATFAELEDLDAGGELEAAFEEADSCDELESGAP